MTNIRNFLHKTILKDGWFQRLAWHFCLAVLSFSCLAFFTKKVCSDDPVLAFAFTAFAVLVLGTIHDWALWAFHIWLTRSFQSIFLISFCIWAVGALVFIWVYCSPENIPFIGNMMGALLVFLLPISIRQGILERKKVPPQSLPGQEIEDLHAARALMSLRPVGDRYLRLKFDGDKFGYLPRFMLVPVEEGQNHLKISDVLKAAILFNNERRLPHKPIDIQYITTGGVQHFAFYFRRKHFLFFKKYLTPDTSAGDLQYNRIKVRDEQGQILQIRCATIYISRKLNTAYHGYLQFSA
jgi:hypothetical protein